jgi:hypothetical protein
MQEWMRLPVLASPGLLDMVSVPVGLKWKASSRVAYPGLSSVFQILLTSATIGHAYRDNVSVLLFAVFIIVVSAEQIRSLPILPHQTPGFQVRLHFLPID